MTTPVIINYHGIDILANFSGAGTLLLMDTLKELANRIGTVNLTTVNPTTIDDASNNYFVWSRWINTVTGQEFVCIDNTDGNAVWINIGGNMPTPFESNAVSVSNKDIMAIDKENIYVLTITGNSIINFEIENASNMHLTDFAVVLKDHANGQIYIYLSGVDWSNSTNANMLFSTPDNLYQLANGPSYGHAHILVHVACTVYFRGLVEAGTSTANFRIRGTVATI